MGWPRGRPVRRHWHYRNRVRLADSLIRKLHITRRRIPSARAADYARLWAAVRDAASDAGGRAWVFVAEGSTDLFVEFIEWQGESVLDAEAVSAALETLDQTFYPGESGTWQQATI